MNAGGAAGASSTQPASPTRPPWATGLAVFCAATVGFLVVRDLFVPEVRDTEVWLGFELHGGPARWTAPLHWGVFACGAWGYWRMRPWVWPWASVYAFQIALGHLVWNVTSPAGGGWGAGWAQLALFSVPAVGLLWARPERGPRTPRAGGGARMLIRRACDRDLPRVAEIHVAGWRTAYAELIDPARLAAISTEERRILWREAFAVSGSELWVAESEGGDVIGFGRLLPARDLDVPEGSGEVSHLYLEPSCCDRGLGGELLRHLLASADARGFTGVLLWVLEGNARARHFYEREGFTADGARKTDPDWHGPGVVEVRYRRPSGCRG